MAAAKREIERQEAEAEARKRLWRGRNGAVGRLGCASSGHGDRVGIVKPIGKGVKGMRRLVAQIRWTTKKGHSRESLARVTSGTTCQQLDDASWIGNDLKTV
jgi:hypothetical protein